MMSASPALAVSPSARWSTVETPHFRIHYPAGPNMPLLAQRLARTCEAAHAALTPRLNWTPATKTDVLLTDDVDSSNGSASSFLRPVMTFYAEQPDDLSVLNDYDDWLWGLVVHEYAHILHLDNATGPPAWLNAVFGKLFNMNELLPRWYTEGLATFEESNLSSGGRLRSSLFDAWLRATVIEGKTFSLAETTHVPVRWPRGSLAYLYGGHFLGFIARKHGEEALARFNARYGARLIPYALNATALDAMGEDFISLYREWQEDLKRQYEAQLAPVRAAGLTPFTPLTTSGQGTSQPRFSPDGSRLFYVEVGPDRRPAIRSIRPDGSDGRSEVRLWTDATFDLSPDGNRVAFSAADVHDQFYVFEDLSEADLKTHRTRRLTWGLRATEPEYAPDGKTLAFVGRSGGGFTYLGLYNFAARTVTKLYEPPLEGKVFTPTFTPEGDALVFGQQVNGGRHLRRLQLNTGEVTTLLGDRFMNVQPRFADAQTLLFSSDRTGIYNLYAMDLATGEVHARSNVETGAFHPEPSPDGGSLAFTHYSSRGYDVAVMKGGDVPALPERAARPAPLYSDAPSVTYPVTGYRPWRSLLPQYWLPYMVGDPRGYVLGVQTAGSDVVGRHAWSASAGYGVTSREPTASIEYQAHVIYPVLSFAAGTGIAQAPGFAAGLYDRHWLLQANAQFPYDTLDSSMAVTFSYEWRLIDPQHTVHLEPDDPVPVLPRRGTVGALGVTFSWSNVRRYAFSISPEEGHAFSLTVRKSMAALGGSFDFTTAQAQYQTYLALPWKKHHVAALRLSGAAALGDVGSRRVYSLGGIALNDPVMQALEGDRASGLYLRGYPPGAFSGNLYLLGTLEYRFPLADLDFGLGTLPLFFRRLHGAAFADVATLGDGALQLGPVRPSVGLELRTELTVAYALGAELRLGLARGLSSRGIWDVYLALGSSF